MSATFASSKNTNHDNLPFIDPTSNGPLITYLSSDLAKKISGQIFGCGGERLALMIQPHYGKTLKKDEGWSIQDIDGVMEKEFIHEFKNLGMLGIPYPFHEGVFPPGVAED